MKNIIKRKHFVSKQHKAIYSCSIEKAQTYAILMENILRQRTISVSKAQILPCSIDVLKLNQMLRKYFTFPKTT